MSEPIIIVGGGAVGATHGEGRALAFRRILEKLGLWNKLAQHATAINSIHVSQLDVMKSIKQHLVSKMRFAK